MKKAFILLTLQLMTYTLYGQEENYHHTVTAHYPVSVEGGIMKAAIKTVLKDDPLNEENSLTFNSNPGILVGYEYSIDRHWSFGGFYYRQVWDGSFSFNYKNQQQEVISELVNYEIKRSGVGATARFHYTMKNERFDLYSGMRFGVVKYQIKTNSSYEDIDEIFDKIKLVRPAVGLTAIGARYYIIPNLALSGELHIGAPNILGFGVNITL